MSNYVSLLIHSSVLTLSLLGCFFFFVPPLITRLLNRQTAGFSSFSPFFPPLFQSALGPLGQKSDNGSLLFSLFFSWTPPSIVGNKMPFPPCFLLFASPRETMNRERRSFSTCFFFLFCIPAAHANVPSHPPLPPHNRFCACVDQLLQKFYQIGCHFFPPLSPLPPLVPWPSRDNAMKARYRTFFPGPPPLCAPRPYPK